MTAWGRQLPHKRHRATARLWGETRLPGDTTRPEGPGRLVWYGSPGAGATRKGDLMLVYGTAVPRLSRVRTVFATGKIPPRGGAR
jgi:hypothetical protein